MSGMVAGVLAAYAAVALVSWSVGVVVLAGALVVGLVREAIWRWRWRH